MQNRSIAALGTVFAVLHNNVINISGRSGPVPDYICPNSLPARGKGSYGVKDRKVSRSDRTYPEDGWRVSWRLQIPANLSIHFRRGRADEVRRARVGELGHEILPSLSDLGQRYCA